MATTTKTKVTSGDLLPFRDLTKTLEQFKVAGVDTSAFVEARRKDVAALTAANKIAYEALQGLARTQADMLTQALESMHESATGALTMSVGGADATKHTDAAQKAWQKMLSDINELGEMARKAQANAMAGLSKRAQENAKAITDLAHASK
jgi:Phasin protein